MSNSDFELVITSPIDESHSGTDSERLALLKSIRVVAEDLFGGRREANKVLLSPALLTVRHTSALRKIMDDRHYRVQLFQQWMGNVYS